MGDSFKVTFNLKLNRSGSSVPYIYGEHPSLGGDDPHSGIQMTPVNSPYNYVATITFDEPYYSPINYSYCYKTQFGAIIHETVPIRTLPVFKADAQIYDSSNSSTTLSGVLLRFRVRCHTTFGQELFVSGNCEELGEWTKEKAVPLFHEGKEDFWSINVTLPLSESERTINYKYFVSRSGGVDFWEPETNHSIVLGASKSPSCVEIADTFRWEDPVMDAFTRAAFVSVVNHRESPSEPSPIVSDEVKPGTVETYFSCVAPYVRSEQKLVVCGSSPQLGSWNPQRGLHLADGKFPVWGGRISLSRKSFPIEYKYVIINQDGTAIWESEKNRMAYGVTVDVVDTDFPVSLFINEWFVCPNRNLFKGLGVYVPLFSLRTSESLGIGQYPDIKKMVDVCNKIGSSLIQLLPINDTTDQGDWADSYPYKQVSCFALHPIFIDLLSILPELPSEMFNEILYKKNQLEAKAAVEYPEVYAFKMQMLERIYDLIKDSLIENVEFRNFISENKSWLHPYALFCHLRDEFKSQKFREWPKYSEVTLEQIEELCEEKGEQLQFIYWQQFICNIQYRASFNYAAEKRVVIKGDLPIGVNIDSVECWAYPKLFRLHMCAGAPPDQFSSDGQNWGFPTYDWEYMATTDYEWWRKRLSRMAELYHALRVDHVLGFFRIWENPRETCVRGLLGHFFPSHPLSRRELESMGLWDIERYVKPHIVWEHLQKKFGYESADIAAKYLTPRGVSVHNDLFDFKEEYNTEVKISNEIDNDETLSAEKKKHYKTCFFELLGNVLLVPDTELADHYHCRTEITTEHIEKTPTGSIKFISTSWSDLPEPQRSKFESLYTEYFYFRQTALWVEKAAPKLEILKKSTNMLICAEDLGQITEGIIAAITRSALLSLRVQRMSKDPRNDFDVHHHFPYLSVCCPSTHDCSSLRGWWTEDREITEKFWRQQLLRYDPVPSTLEPWMQEMIVKQHLWSNSMWAVFLLQDITGMIPSLRRQDPNDERINLPSDPNQKWQYRYPFSLEELGSHYEFVSKMKGLVTESHRI